MRHKILQNAHTYKIIIHINSLPVILFVVPWHTLRDYLLIAHDLGMANGEYAFVCLHGDVRMLRYFLYLIKSNNKKIN